MANRMAQFLGLSRLDVRKSPIEREVGKRICLTLFVADRWHSVGSGIPLQLRDDFMPKEAAIDEHIFHSPLFAQQSDLPSHRIGLWALRTSLAEIFSDIQLLTMEVANGNASQQNADLKAEVLASRLDSWYSTLPSRFVFNAANLELHRQHHTGGSFIDLFLGFHHYTTVLFFQYLGRQSPTTTDRHPYTERCRQHAVRYSSLLAMSRSNPGCEAIHNTVGQMTVVSSSALLYFLLSGDTGDEPIIRSALLSNFAAIRELDSYWPAANRWVERLFIFQNKCTDWPLFGTFAMDRWMMRFLLEYALPLEESDGKSKSPLDSVFMSKTTDALGNNMTMSTNTIRDLERLL